MFFDVRQAGVPPLMDYGWSMPNKSKPVRPKRKTPKPKPKVAKVEADWKEVIKKAVKKKHPSAGWPEG